MFKVFFVHIRKNLYNNSERKFKNPNFWERNVEWAREDNKREIIFVFVEKKNVNCTKQFNTIQCLWVRLEEDWFTDDRWIKFVNIQNKRQLINILIWLFRRKTYFVEKLNCWLLPIVRICVLINFRFLDESKLKLYKSKKTLKFVDEIKQSFKDN